ncbi:MAG: DEAD/DEAH box helicase [Desulfarculaceae bacterium]|nr:DEAD/DEAH box helicase [Desulfarculaceae bacterium]
MSLAEYLHALKNYKGFAGDIVCHRVLPERKPEFSKEDGSLPETLYRLCQGMGIDRLYRHQQQAVELILQGHHTVISTPTASGKSLVYNLPVMNALMENPASRALYLFPLKALARDQLESVRTCLEAAEKESSGENALSAQVYDGDVSSHHKSRIRRNPPNILMSNPEMLHMAMLAHHHLWKEFFSNLKFVVVDEVHTYRGVMGSNMAWVFRRLKRICEHYGATPTFIFCSATIANPADLAGELTGLPVKVVDHSTAGTGKKNVILMKGLNGAAGTALDLLHAAAHRGLRTIVYAQSRKITELIAIWASRRAGKLSEKISAYRAGFLPEERREIERRLSSGDILAVVSTSALELGIDIGCLDLCILVGYPGTIMSTWQRAGRVGRGGRESATIFVAHEDALDHYFVNNPSRLFDMPPERAVINPENRIIMKRHIECAAADLSIHKSEPLMRNPAVAKAAESLTHEAKLLQSADGSVWHAARQSVHRHVSLRGTGTRIPIFLKETGRVLGEADRYRAFHEVHEGAVYLHHKESYLVTTLDHEKGFAEVSPSRTDYYTRARSDKETEIIEVKKTRKLWNTRVGLGRLKVTETVTGYEKKRVSNGKSLGVVPLDLPKIEFETEGLWIEIPDTVKDRVENAKMHFMGGIHAMEHAAIGILPLLVMTDRNDLGGISIVYHDQLKKAAVFVYDGIPGGLGFSQHAFEKGETLLENTLAAIAGCGCETGCPVCVHSPKCGSGNRPIDKNASLSILKLMKNGNKETVSQPLTEIGISSAAEREENPDPRSGEHGNMARFGVLDIETRRSAEEVGGWGRAERMGMSCAVLYDSKTDRFNEYLAEDIDKLEQDLSKMDLVIGFNLIRFDYKVLSGISDFNYNRLATLDMLDQIHKKLGYRLSLDRLAKETLNSEKSADGLMALKWWRQGKIRKIVAYCRQDVKVTRDLYLYGRRHGYLLFRNKAGMQVRVPVVW